MDSMTDRIARLDLPETHLHALEFLLKRLPLTEYIWVLSGSGGLRLQGVDVPVHDLDIQTDEKNIYLIEKKLARFMKMPVHIWDSPGMRSLDGRAVVRGIEIELLANIAHCQPDGSWYSHTDLSRLIWVLTHSLRIPVFPLEDELDAYLAMGRTEKAALIRQAIQQAGKVNFGSPGTRYSALCRTINVTEGIPSRLNDTFDKIDV
jgi:hypothetical protein